MFQKRPIALAVRAALGLTAGLSALPLMAQEQASTPDQALVETIIVTGSRIERANEVTSSPVVQLNAEQIAFTGTTRIEDAVAQLPQVFMDQSSGQSIESEGTATVQLRNLGVSRTLVLIDGKRLPISSPTSTESGPDLNFIPVGLVERVEVLTGGASATYGSDAVAGVVNFTMRDDFEGVSLDYQSSGYRHDNNGNVTSIRSAESGFDYPSGTISDGEIDDLSLIIGGNLNEGRGNVTAYATYRNVEAVTQSERDYSACALRSGTRACGGSGTSAAGSFYRLSPPDQDPGPGVVTVGNPFYFNVQGDQFVDFSTDSLFNFAPPSYFQRPDERYTMGSFAHYDLTEQATVYTQLMWMDDQTVAQFAPAGLFYDFPVDIGCDNPLLSAQQVSAMGCVAPTDVIDGVFIGRRNVEGGPRAADINHSSFRGVFGLNGDINDAWRYDVSYQYAEVDMSVRNSNYVDTGKIAKALDVVADPTPGVGGAPVCRSVVDGSDPNCLPWNIWEAGGVTAAAVNYLGVSYYEQGKTDQTVATGYLQGNLGEYGVKLPWADNGIDVVIGLERRQENLDYQPDDLSIEGAIGGLAAALVPTSGGYTVEEIFTEAKIPIVEGKRFAEQVTLDLGYRYSDYDTDVDTDTYKIAGSWAIDEQIKLRGSFQRAVRAANIVELFQPVNGNLFSMDSDPCSTVNLGTGLSAAGYTFAQCARSGVTQTVWDNGGVGNSPAKQYNTVLGGNTDLAPEESDTYSAGFVLTPNFLENLLLSVDWYNIKVDGAITQVNGETTLTQCLEGSDAACLLVHRNQASSGSLFRGNASPTNGVDAFYLNSGYFEVTGIDVEASYSMDIGDRWGNLAFSTFLAYVDSWEQEEYPGTGSESCEGLYGDSCETPLPKLRNLFNTTWTTPWDVALNLSWRYIDSVEMVSSVPVANRIDIDSYNLFDIAGIWNVTDYLALRAGVNNVLDEEPPITDNGVTLRNNGNTYPGGYDHLGQYWFLAASVTM
jgi:outer membrane receptor protein involved in Fe transport